MFNNKKNGKQFFVLKNTKHCIFKEHILFVFNCFCMFLGRF